MYGEVRIQIYDPECTVVQKHVWKNLPGAVCSFGNGICFFFLCIGEMIQQQKEKNKQANIQIVWI
jgi:hypothetical protein